MKFAAIDIGSNSIHLIVAEVFPDGHYVVIDKAKNMVGLAQHTLADGYLSDQAIRRGLSCLKTFRKLCAEHGVTHIEAVATSAVREAVNGEHFIQRVAEAHGIDVRVISGEEEARLIYLGAREHIDWVDRRGLIVDIGGGSVEFIVGNEQEAELYVSLPLGVRRLSEAFLASDPPRRTELKQLRTYLEDALAPLKKTLAEHPFDFVIGSSGTLTNLARMAARRNDLQFQASHGLWVSLQDLKEMGRALAGLREKERADYHGVDPKRADTIAAGAQLIKYILRAVGADAYVACDYALRDGMVIDFIARQGVDLADVDPSQRRRSVRAVLNRFNTIGAHPKDTARLTLSLFDQLQEVHGLDRPARERLQYCALLHDVGRVIHVEGHPDHSAYIIRHGELRGFSAEEKEEMALVVRAHMGRAQDVLKDPGMLALEPEARQRALAMAALLRLGDALDRARTSNVPEVTVAVRKGSIVLKPTMTVDTGMERGAVEHKGDLFTALFQKKVVFS